MDDFDTPGLPIVPSTWITFGDILVSGSGRFLRECRAQRKSALLPEAKKTLTECNFEIKELIPFSVPLGQAISGDFPLQKPKQSLPSAIQFTLFFVR